MSITSDLIEIFLYLLLQIPLFMFSYYSLFDIITKILLWQLFLSALMYIITTVKLHSDKKIQKIENIFNEDFNNYKNQIEKNIYDLKFEKVRIDLNE